MNKFFATSFVAVMAIANLTLQAAQPYDSVQNLPATPYFVQDGYIFYDLINTHQSAVIVDVESQDGSVARYIAQQAPSLSSLQTIFCVNSWDDTDTQRHNFQRFLSNVKQENSADAIVPIRMSSLEAAESLNVEADFISLVGSNDQYEIYNEILAWFPHLRDGGVIAGNNWNENAIQVGVTTAAQALNLHLRISGNVWYFVNSSQ